MPKAYFYIPILKGCVTEMGLEAANLGIEAPNLLGRKVLLNNMGQMMRTLARRWHPPVQ